VQREQAGAGLDRLTPAEMVTFTQLNTDYKAKFAFPFILAVKGAACRKNSLFTASHYGMHAPPNQIFWKRTPSGE
jgi:2-oxo-4-hydroxy-4-carboxy--5-ureidoimidazoline (OHCU) decarboxylase